MPRPYDLSKLKKNISKNIPGVSYGFNDPKTWMDTGSFVLNYLVSNRFDGGLPLEGKFCLFAGDSGSGKSYIATANVIRYCQRNKIWPNIIDTENALDEWWLDKIGDIDTSEDGMDKFSVATVDDCAKLVGTLIESYEETQGSKPYAQREKMVIIIDSLGMLITNTQEAQFMAGDQKGDMGIKAKQITNMLRVTMSKIASHPVGVVATNHVFDAQDKYKPDAIPGGKMLEFASSVIVQMNKYLLKEDEDGAKLKDGAVSGIRTTAVVRKSRYAKPFERMKIDIPYDTGMDPYSGLFDLFLSMGIIRKEGVRYSYASPETGEVFTDYRKHYKAKGILDTIMADWKHWEKGANKLGFDEATGSGEYEDETYAAALAAEAAEQEAVV